LAARSFYRRSGNPQPLSQVLAVQFGHHHRKNWKQGTESWFKVTALAGILIAWSSVFKEIKYRTVEFGKSLIFQ